MIVPAAYDLQIAMPRALMRLVSVCDDMLRELADPGLLLSAFMIVEIGEGSERGLALVAKTPNKNQQLSDASAPSEETTIELRGRSDSTTTC
jgi:hypothetical protein